MNRTRPVVPLPSWQGLLVNYQPTWHSQMAAEVSGFRARQPEEACYG